jgi:hypothetical protein
MSTKNFDWRGPDPTTWPWEWCGHSPGYLDILAEEGGSRRAIASIRNGKLVRIFAHSKALGNTIAFWNDPAHNGTLYEAECSSWAEGVKMAEEWLETIPLWGTKDSIHWTGLIERKA